MQQNDEAQVESNKNPILEIFVNCRDLQRLSHKIFVELYEENDNNNWTFVGKTENLESSQNPNFVNTIKIKYIFEKDQHIKVQLKQVSAETITLVGEAVTRLAQIFGSKLKNANICKLMNKGISVGNVILRTNIVKEYFQKLHIKFSATNIPDLRGWFWQKTSPFLKFHRLIDDYGGYTPVHITEVIRNCLNPSWNQFEIDAQRICNGDLFMPIKVELLDYESEQKQNFLGETTFTLNEAKDKEIQNQKLQKKLRNRAKNNIETGILRLDFFQLKSKYSFAEYRKGGLQLNLSIAIDFTKSNKVQYDPTSLHFLSQSQTSEDFTSPYLEAIKKVSEILIVYDDDKKVAMYGFGCQPTMNYIHPGKEVEIFNLNDNTEDPEVFGVDGIIQCYINALPKLRFSAPSNLHTILSEAMKKSKNCQKEGDDLYQILLILTDGKIDDMANCIDDIIASSHIPLSIIIVGIGDADFKNMNILDNDDMTLVDSKGRKSQRDLVQFVPFRNYGNDPKILAEQVLEELPRQVEEYMELMDKKPNVQNQNDQNDIQNQQHRQVFI